MKSKYIWHAGEWVDVTNWRPPPRRTPYIIRDAMDAAMHPATGEMMDSKSRFREATRAHGLVEVGNDWRNSQNPRMDDVNSVKKDVAEAIERLEAGAVPPPVESIGSLDGEAVIARMYGD